MQIEKEEKWSISQLLGRDLDLERAMLNASLTACSWALTFQAYSFSDPSLDIRFGSQFIIQFRETITDVFQIIDRIKKQSCHVIFAIEFWIMSLTFVRQNYNFVAIVTRLQDSKSKRYSNLKCLLQCKWEESISFIIWNTSFDISANIYGSKNK